MRIRDLEREKKGYTGLWVSIICAILVACFLCFLLGMYVIGPYFLGRIRGSRGVEEFAKYEKPTVSREAESKVAKPGVRMPVRSPVLIVPEPVAKPLVKTVQPPRPKPRLRMPSVPVQPPVKAVPKTTEKELEGEPKPETTVTTKEYKIQLGSFKDKANSDARVEELKGKGYQPFVVTEKESDGTESHKVYIGGFKDRARAKEVLGNLTKEGYEGFIPED